MKQQYIVIPKQNEWLHDLIGKSLKQSIVHKALEDLYDEHRVICRPGLAKAIVTVSDTKTKEILSIGGSSILQNIKTGKKIADITNRNFPNFFTPFGRSPVNANSNGNWFRRSGGGAFGIRVINVANGTAELFNETNNAVEFLVGSALQVGSGITAPTNTDFNIETAFGSSPEDSTFGLGGGAYNEGLNQMAPSAGIVAGGTGTVNESAWHLFSTGSSFAELNKSYMLFHDAISPGVAFIATQTITVSYLLQF